MQNELAESKYEKVMRINAPIWEALCRQLEGWWRHYIKDQQSPTRIILLTTCLEFVQIYYQDKVEDFQYQC